MTGICGWTNVDCRGKNPSAVLDDMAKGLVATPTMHSLSGQANNASLLAQTDQGQHHFHEGDGLLAAIVGQPCWSDSQLSQVARDQGHGSALATAYRKHQHKLLDHLNGPFAMAVIDKQTGNTLLAIDRIGIHRMCYSTVGGKGLVFGSTTDAVRKHPGIGSTLDNQHIFSYLFFHAVPSPGTIYQEQNKLLPGEYVHFNEGRVERDIYWKPKFNDAPTGDFSALKTELRSHLQDAVKKCTGSHTRVGAFLSGGVDSSTVSGMLSKTLDTPVNTYSIGFSAKGYDEMEFARVASTHFGTVHHEYYVAPDDVANAIPRIAQVYDEPFGNASAVPTFFCAQLAKNNGTDILLSGDGGDELFGGNKRYAQQKIFEFYHSLPFAVRSWVLEPLVSGFPAGDKIMPIRKARSYIKQANIPLPDRLESYNFINRVAHEQVFNGEFLSSIDPHHPQALQRTQYSNANSSSIINKMLYLEWKQVLADNDLRKVTRMCSLAGVDAQFPLLQDNIIEFSTRLPPSFKVKGLKLRYFFKEALRDFLPPQTLTKSKHGFGLPFGIWLSTHPRLQQLAQDSLSDLKRRQFLHPDFIDKLTKKHKDEHAAFYGEAIWVFMMLEQWLQAHDL